MSWREYLNVGQLFLGNKAVQIKSYDVDIVVGADAGTTVAVTIQFNDPEGKALEEVAVVDWYLSSDANGVGVAATAPSGGIAIGTDGELVELVADKVGVMISEIDGDVDLVVTEVGAATWYLVLRLPCGGLVISDPITFT